MRTNSRRFAAVVLCFLIALSSLQTAAFAAPKKTGVGMAEWALRAYNEGWKYVFGSEEVGAVDCSGLIRSYINGGGGALALLNASQESGDISTMPNVHGLGLWCDGHAGVYVGKNSSGTNMAVDARNSKVNVVYSTMDSRSWNPWVKWFKVQGVTYPTTGWESFNGDEYYYYNGEFVTGIFTVDGVTYDFGKSGALIGKAQPTTATTTTTTAPTTATTAKPTTTTAKTTTTQTTKKTTTKKTTTTTEPTTTTTTAARALKQGMSGDRVAELQRRLIELGYMDAKATGYFGNQTVAAVKAFQRNVSLTPDGIAGKATMEKLFADNAPKMTTATAATTTTTTTVAPTTTTTTAAPTTTSSAAADTTTATAASQSAVTTASTEVTTTTTTLSAIEILLNMDAEQYSQQYVELEFGTSGYDVKMLQQRLADLGYFDSRVDGYYGVFLRIAVSQFQASSGITETGIADAETQALLYSKYAPLAGETLHYGTEFDSSDYMIDEGDYVEEALEEEPIQELESTDGLSVFATKTDIPAFTRRFGSGGALQTLGITSHSEPVVLVVYSGDCFELTEELQDTIEECVFF